MAKKMKNCERKGEMIKIEIGEMIRSISWKEPIDMSINWSVVLF